MPVKFLSRFWTSISKRSRQLTRQAANGDVTARAIKLADGLLSEHGESAAAARADALTKLYRELNGDERHAFHLYLATNFLPEPVRLKAAAQAYLKRHGPETAAELTAAAVPTRQDLLRRMNMAPGATGLLVKMRETLLKAAARAPELKPLEQDLAHLLGAWFNRGFLELRSIDWNSSAALLEKLIAYEAVHEIHGWNDLRRRLAPDRRCFAFFHPALPDEPLIFVEVALCEGIADNIAPLLAGPPRVNGALHADTAVFYSISNCQAGLRGIAFGNLLLTQVVEELSAELPQLKCFVTLSPIPSFRRWLEKRLTDEDHDLLLESECALLGEPALKSFADALAVNDWQNKEPVLPSLKPILQRLCAQYLTAGNEGRGPDDPVARFHLRNGARLERLNWCANTNDRGIAEAYGLMANYLYDPATIDASCEKFATSGEVTHSAEVAELAGESSKQADKRTFVRAAE
jgi:malonyl-CoA decarboxylase